MNFNSYKYFFSVFGSIAIALNAALVANATDEIKVAKQLVNSLNIKAEPTIYVTKNLDNSNNKQREYVFKAPDNKVISNPQQLTKRQGYKVEVYGSADELLKQVKDIEPKAFRKGKIIQVGIFSQQGNAEILVRKLAVAGFWARIVSQ